MSVVIDGTLGVTTPQINAGNIVGEVAFFARNTAPEGWLKANGAAVSRTTYSALFAEIGTTYGSGDGSTTFELPDMRGEFPRGWDDGRGVDSGRSFGTAQTDEFKSHTHGVDVSVQNTSNPADTAARIATGFLRFKDTTSRGGVETRPRNIALLACIKF